MNLSKQQESIINLLRKQHEVNVSQITNDRNLGGLGIKGYTERITELRKKGFVISNIRKNWYTLSYDPDKECSSFNQKKTVLKVDCQPPADPTKIPLWNEMKAYLSGEGKKPETLEVLEALL